MDKFKELIREILSDGYSVSLERGPAAPGAGECPGGSDVVNGDAFLATVWTGNDECSEGVASGINEDPLIALAAAKKGVTAKGPGRPSERA